MDKGGRTKRIIQEQQALKGRGHNVNIVVFSQPPEWILQQYTGSSQWRILKKKPAKFDFTLAWKLLSLLYSIKADIVHGHCEASFLYSGLACKLLRTPIVGTYHRSDLRYYQPTRQNRFYAMLLSHCIAISKERMNRMTQQLGIPRKKITLVHSGIEASEVTNTLDIQQLRKQLSLPPSGKIIFSAGHLGPIKGHDDSIAALPQLLKRFPDISLYIAGDGTPADHQRLKQLITQHQLMGHVHLLGQINNTLSWMQACNIFLQPSHEEGFGLVFIEAGLCEKPVVATNIGGIPDIILDGETGFLVPPRNAQQIADRIAQLLDDPTPASAMGQAAKHRVLKYFSVENQINKLASIYEKQV